MSVRVVPVVNGSEAVELVEGMEHQAVMLALAACDASVVNGIVPFLGKHHKGTLIALKDERVKTSHPYIRLNRAN